jgi:hypothetical protein
VEQGKKGGGTMKHHVQDLDMDVTIPIGWHVVKVGKIHVSDKTYIPRIKRFRRVNQMDVGWWCKCLLCLIRKDRA